MSYRITWDGRKGAVRRDLRCAELHGPPDLGAGPVAELEFAPEWGVRAIRPRAVDERRDLSIDEERAAIELCRAFHPSGPAPL